MQELIRQSIEQEARKRLEKFSKAQNLKTRFKLIYEKRTGKKAVSGTAKLPFHWKQHNQFNPKYCIKHSKFLAKSIWASLNTHKYKPLPSIRTSIKKANGDYRDIDIFGIPDAAVAKLFLERICKRNNKIFSDGSYAYQKGKRPLDAVVKISNILRMSKVFVTQYDFKNYFGSISHAYIEEVIGKDGPFLLTEIERRLIQSTIKHDFYSATGTVLTRDVGTPQGNSLSLFVANAAAHALDCELGRISGIFARFADDSVVINDRYDDALRAEAIFAQFSKRSGTKINEEKSTGIRIMARKPVEMREIESFDFLGYRVTSDGLQVGGGALVRIKKRCAKIIYNNLFLYPKRHKVIDRRRIGRGFRDWDFVTCMNELRRYIYGKKTQETIDGYLNGKERIKSMSGAVSYFSLVESGEQFKKLDGWLLDCVHRAYIKRTKVVGHIHGKVPAIISKATLKNGKWYNFKKINMESRIPSFYTAWRAARKSWAYNGADGVDAEGLGYSYT